MFEASVGAVDVVIHLSLPIFLQPRCANPCPFPTSQHMIGPVLVMESKKIASRELSEITLMVKVDR